MLGMIVQATHLSCRQLQDRKQSFFLRHGFLLTVPGFAIAIEARITEKFGKPNCDQEI